MAAQPLGQPYYFIRFEVTIKGGELLLIFQATFVDKTYQARIYVTLRPSVLDPAGTAVESGLKQLGYASVEGVRIGKYVELKLGAASETDARQQLDQMCDQLLANPVIENYCFEVVELAPVTQG